MTPPSTFQMAPVTQLVAGESRNVTVLARSRSLPTRPSGWKLSKLCRGDDKSLRPAAVANLSVFLNPERARGELRLGYLPPPFHPIEAMRAQRLGETMSGPT
jgi:hypothetical protein